MTHEPKRRTLLLGWRGGVGRAVLGLLCEHPRGRELMASRALVMLDADDGPIVPLPAGARVLAPRRITNADDLGRLIHQHRITEVIELALVDTFACIDVCARQGADYLTTSLERWQDDATLHGALDDAQLLLPERRPVGSGGSHLVGSGMNPGCVNALFDHALAAFADVSGVAADQLDLYAMFVSESDTTECDDTSAAFGMTWRPESCLAELFVPAALVVDEGRVRTLDHAPLEAEYRVACGADDMLAHLVPHDELVTLGARRPDLAFAYAYALPPTARRFLAAQPRGADPRQFPLRRMWPPHATGLRGRDRVGVLLCSRRFGELWCGFDTDVADALRWGTNATLLQVAAGVLAGWAQLGRKAGIHVVEELDTAKYLERVCDVLGPVSIVHRSDAPFRTLLDRRE